MEFYVLNDPSGDYPPGTRLQDAEARTAANHDVAVIPIDPDIYQVRSAVSGFFRVDFGKGVPLPMNSGPFAHLTLSLAPQSGYLHWRACVQLGVPTDPFGEVRLVPDSSQYGTTVGIQSDPVRLENFHGWKDPFIIGGTCALSSPPSGLVGFALWGVGDARLYWAAISQTSSKATYVVNPQDAVQPLEWNQKRKPIAGTWEKVTPK